MKHKSATIGFSYLSGLIFSFFLNEFIAFVFSGVFILVGIILAIKKKPNVIAFFICSSAGLAVFAIYSLLVYNPVVAMDGKTLELNGTVTEKRLYSNDLSSYMIDTEINGIDTTVYLFGQDVDVNNGDRISFTATLSVFENTADFGTQYYYRSKGLFLRATAKSEILITPSDDFNMLNVISDYSDYISERIRLFLPGEEGDLLASFFLGDKSGLSDELESNIQRSGVSHFAAVSGAHLSLVANIIMLILSAVGLKRFRKLSYGILVAIVIAFMVFFKLSPSVIRSGIMLIVYYGAEPLMRRSDTLNSLGVAALVILLFNPYACLDVGLLMSLSGTFGIGVLSPYICSQMKKENKLLSLVIGSVSAIICVMPLSIIYFGGFSTIGILTNLLITPLFVFALATVFIFTVIGGNGYIFMFVAGLCSKAMIWIISFFGNLKYAFVQLEQDFIPFVFVLSVLFCFAVFLFFRKPERVMMAVGVCACVIVFSVTADGYIHKDDINIDLYSDGEDACIIVSGKGAAFVAAGSDSPEILNEIKSFMRNNFIDELSAMYVLDKSNNNLSAFSLIPCREFVLTSGNKYSVDGIVMECDESFCRINIGEYSISLSDISNPCDGEICILNGYKKDRPSVNGVLVFYADKRIDSENNIFYRETSLAFVDDVLVYCEERNGI